MIKVYQKIISGDNGDCLGACLGSLLHREDYPDLQGRAGMSWLDVWNDYLEKDNLQLVSYSFGSSPVPRGYAILSVKSALFEGELHAVVFKGDGWDGKIVHNPNPEDPRGIDVHVDDWVRFTMLCLLDPSKI